jgi:hypothetical protein
MSTLFYAPRPKEADYLLWEQNELMHSVQMRGGLKTAVFKAKRVYEQPPWLAMPSNAVPFQRAGSIALPPNNGNDNQVLTFTVPQGYDGVITALVQNYTGTGFVDGSGNLRWRLRIGMKFARDMGDMIMQLGSMASPYQIYRAGLLVHTGQRVRYLVSHSTGSSLSGGSIICALFGWFYPTA